MESTPMDCTVFPLIYADPLSGVEENIAYNAFLVGKSLLGLRVSYALLCPVLRGNFFPRTSTALNPLHCAVQSLHCAVAAYCTAALPYLPLLRGRAVGQCSAARCFKMPHQIPQRNLPSGHRAR